MFNKIIRLIFFGNYFIGFLAVMLSVEMSFQLDLPFNEPAYYVLLFLAPIIYYTYAYQNLNETSLGSNERTRWYLANSRSVYTSQIVLSLISIGLLVYLCIQFYHPIIHLPVLCYLITSVIFLAGVFYYGLISRTFFGFELRKTGWLKSFIIGFVWAGCVNVFPLIMLRIETSTDYFEPILWTWFFIKTWIFCTVIAIMFDIKDYPGDSNHQLRTFVVRFGLRKTIFFILIPLLILGLMSFCFFGFVMKMELLRFLINLIPFVVTLCIALTLIRRHKIMYYLIVIDGVILLKAICGILGVVITRNL